MEKLDQDKIVVNLRSQMARLGINQASLSRLAGISPAALSQILRKDRSPSTAVLAKLANALGVSMDYLLGASHDSDFEDIVQHGKAKTLVANFSGLSVKDQQRVLDLIEALKSTAKTT